MDIPANKFLSSKNAFTIIFCVTYSYIISYASDVKLLEVTFFMTAFRCSEKPLNKGVAGISKSKTTCFTIEGGILYSCLDVIFEGKTSCFTFKEILCLI